MGKEREGGREGIGKREFIQGHCPGFAPITCGLGRREGGRAGKGGLISHIQCISYNQSKALLPGMASLL